LFIWKLGPIQLPFEFIIAVYSLTINDIGFEILTFLHTIAAETAQKQGKCNK